jgi:hypothetical protein
MTQVYFCRSNPKEVLVDRCGAVVNDLAEARDCRPTSCNPSPTDAVWRFGAGLQINVTARAASGSMSVCRHATTAG